MRFPYRGWRFTAFGCRQENHESVGQSAAGLYSKWVDVSPTIVDICLVYKAQEAPRRAKAHLSERTSYRLAASSGTADRH